jgi:hypothetical protein
LLLNVVLNVEELPDPGTRFAEPNWISSNVPPLFAGNRTTTDPVGGAPLIAVTVPVTVTGASGEVLLEETIAEVVVVMRPDAAAIFSVYVPEAAA